MTTQTQDAYAIQARWVARAEALVARGASPGQALTQAMREWRIGDMGPLADGAACWWYEIVGGKVLFLPRLVRDGQPWEATTPARGRPKLDPRLVVEGWWHQGPESRRVRVAVMVSLANPSPLV